MKLDKILLINKDTLNEYVVENNLNLTELDSNYTLTLVNANILAILVIILLVVAIDRALKFLFKKRDGGLI